MGIVKRRKRQNLQIKQPDSQSFLPALRPVWEGCNCLLWQQDWRRTENEDKVYKTGDAKICTM